jgi:CheY-like chemotaxis protein
MWLRFLTPFKWGVIGGTVILSAIGGAPLLRQLPLSWQRCRAAPLLPGTISRPRSCWLLRQTLSALRMALARRVVGRLRLRCGLPNRNDYAPVRDYTEEHRSLLMNQIELRDQSCQSTRIGIATDVTTCQAGSLRCPPSKQHGFQIREEFRVVREAENGTDAGQLVKRLRPDLVLMEIGLPCLNGMETTAEILRHLPDCKVAILSMYDDENSVVAAIRSGARAFILKKEKGQRETPKKLPYGQEINPTNFRRQPVVAVVGVGHCPVSRVGRTLQ